MDKLNLMNSFVHVAELKSYTAAAAKLNKTKALMSTHVRQLEEVLNVRLISRSTRGFMLTEAGQRYYHQARKIIDEISELEAGLLEGEQQMAGRLRLSVPNTFGERVMMGFMGEFMQRYPKMNVEVMLADQFVDLINQGFDLAIRIGVLQDSTMIAKEIGRSKTVVVASKRLLGDGEFNSPDDLQGMPMIFDTNLRGERQRWTCYHNQQEYVLDLRPTVYINSASASAQLACSGVGLALCPYFAAREYLESGQLEQVLTEYQFGYAPIHAVYPNRQQLSVRARQFINEFAEYLEQEEE